MSDENINICINVVTKKSITEAGNKLDTLGKKGKASGDKIKKSNEEVAKSFFTLQRANLAYTASFIALTAIAIKSVNAFKAFETGLINVEKTTNISGKKLASFGKEIDKLASTIPVSTTELLELSKTAGQLGIVGGRNIIEFTKTVALLTRTTDLTVDSAEKLAQLIAVSNTSITDIGRLGAVLVDLGNNFAATESNILQVSTRIAQSTTQFNLLAEDAVKLGAVIASVGEKAEASGSAIGTAFGNINDAIQKGGDPLIELERLTGLQREQLEKLFESDPTALLKKFTEGINKAGKEGRVINDILATFGLNTQRARRVLSPLIKNTERVNEAFARTSRQMILRNALIDEAEKQFKSLESAEILAGNATNRLSKSIGTALIPAYKSVLDITTSISNSIATFAENNVRSIQVLSTAIVSFGITLGIVLLAAKLELTALTISWFAVGKAAGVAWSLMLLPGTLVVIGITAVAAALSSIIVFWDDIKLAVEIALVSWLRMAAVFSSFSSAATALKITIGQVGLFLLEMFEDNIDKAITFAKVFDQIFKTDTAVRIEKFRASLKKSAEELANQDILLSQTGQNLNKYADDLEKANNKTIESNRVISDRLAQLAKLDAQEKLIIETAKEQGRVLTRLEELDIQRIQKERDRVTGLTAKKKELAKLDAEAKAAQLSELVILQNKFNADIEEINANGFKKGNKSLIAFRTNQLKNDIKSNRDRLIASGKFNEARTSQLELDRLNQEAKDAADAAKDIAKAEKKERDKNEKIKEIKAERDILEQEELQIKAELKIQTDATELSQLRTRLQEIQLVKLEGQELEAELEKRHKDRLDIIRQKDAKKQERVLKNRTNKEIRTKRAHNAVQVELDKTTATALTDIGDNLFKAGILRGKTAGKALKTLKTAEAIVNTYTGATLALSKFPGPVGILAAAGVVASGLASVATIQSQKFATGGIVQLPQNIQRGIDTVPAQLSVGEEVLTANNPRHRNNISNDREDNALLDAVNGLRSDMQTMQTIVTIDGKEVADVIQEQRFRGVS